MKFLMFLLLLMVCPEYIMIGVAVAAIFEEEVDNLYPNWFSSPSFWTYLNKFARLIMLWPVTLIKLSEKIKV